MPKTPSNPDGDITPEMEAIIWESMKLDLDRRYTIEPSPLHPSDVQRKPTLTNND